MDEILGVLQETAIQESGRGEEHLSPTTQEAIMILQFERYTEYNKYTCVGCIDDLYDLYKLCCIDHLYYRYSRSRICRYAMLCRMLNMEEYRSNAYIMYTVDPVSAAMVCCAES